MATTVSSLDFDRLITTDRECLATWKFSKAASQIDHYEVQFDYYIVTNDVKKNSKGTVTGREYVWVRGSESSVSLKQAEYSAPEEATKVRVRVKPVAKKHTVNGKSVAYWTGGWSAYKTISSFGSYVPEPPGAPSIEALEGGYKIRARVENLDSIADQVTFYWSINESSSKQYKVTPKYQAAEYTFSGAAGTKYKVRAKTRNAYTSSGKTFSYESEWSDYSEIVITPPKPPTDFIVQKKTQGGMILQWTRTSNSDHYNIHYASALVDLNGHSGSFSSIDTDGNTARLVLTGLDPGKRWYFRVRAVNADGVAGPWYPALDKDPVSTVLSVKPSPPTTWSSVNVAAIGDTVMLYWMHNTADGSVETNSKLVVKANGVTKINTTLTNTALDDWGAPTDKTRSYSLDTSIFSDGDIVTWYVQTKGIGDEYSDISIERTIKLWEDPNVIVDVRASSSGTSLETVTQFPIYITGSYPDLSQSPIGYAISIVSNDTYETYDDDGTPITIVEGDEVYDIYRNTNDTIEEILNPGDINLQNGINYTVKLTVAFDSGLAAEDEKEFAVEWDEDIFDIDAIIDYDPTSLSAQIVPYCTTPIDEDDLDEEAEPELSENVTLSVYRREANGSFILLESGIPNTGYYTVVDPHPALDYARYRVTATSTTTGVSSYEDLPGYPIGYPGIVIQWEEEWTDYYTDDLDGRIVSEWDGSMLKLPYNVDVSERNQVDSASVEYIGRSRPVSYFGTQLGENMSLSCEVPKYDTETLFQLRRLSAYAGNVYVREPHGNGCWATVSISYNLNTNELTIPVSIDVSPVEGGI